MIPAGNIIQAMALYEKSVDGIYYCDEEIAAFDLSVMGNEHSELLIRRDIFFPLKTSAPLHNTVNKSFPSVIVYSPHFHSYVLDFLYILLHLHES